MNSNKIIGLLVTGVLGYVGYKSYKTGFVFGEALGKGVSREAVAQATKATTSTSEATDNKEQPA